MKIVFDYFINVNDNDSHLQYIMKNFIKLLSFFLLASSFITYLNGQEIEENVEEVVVISSKLPVSVSQVVGSVSLITKDDLETRIVSNLSDIFDNTVGVTVPRNSQYGRYYNEGISIRGLGGSRVNIFLDGVRVSDAYAGYGRDVVDVDLLERIEILKGPTSALYGSDGLAGAVSYSTKNASDYIESGMYYSGRYTKHSDSDQTTIGILTAYVGDRSEALVQIIDREGSEMKLHDDALLEPNPVISEGQSLFTKFKYRLNDNVDFIFTLDSQDWSSKIKVNTDIGSVFYPGLSVLSSTSFSEGSDNGSRDRVNLKINFNSINPNQIFDSGSVNLFTQSTDQQQVTNKIVADMVFGQFGPMGPPSPGALFRDFQFNQSISGVSIEFFKQAVTNVEHNIVYGFERETLESQRYRNSTLTSLITGISSSNVYGTIFPSKTLPDTDTTRTGLYINDRISLGRLGDLENNIITFGARYDAYKLEPNDDALSSVNRSPLYPLAQINENELSLKVGFLTDFSETITGFYQYAEGFKAPDYDSANLSFNNLAYGYGIVPNSELRPETSKGNEIGIRSISSNISWSITKFNNHYEDFIESAPSGFDFINNIILFQSQNLNEVKINGMEISFSRGITDTLSFSYDYITTKAKSNGLQLSSVEPDESIMALKYTSLDKKLSANLYINFVDESFSDFSSGCGRNNSQCLTLSDREILDFYTTYKFNENLELSVAMKNLSDHRYWDWSSVNGFAIDQTNLDLWMEPGRNTSISLKLSF